MVKEKSVEIFKIGELELHSEVLSAEQLAKIGMDILRDPQARLYLDILKGKKLALGVY